MKKDTTNRKTVRKTSTSREAPTWTIGVDIGDKHSQLCVLDQAGEVVEEGRIQTTREAFERRFGGAERARVVIETGGHSRWIEEVVESAGHEVIVANARELPKLSKSIRKSDRNDAELLARLGRSDPKLLSPVEHRSAAAQQGLSLIRARAALVKSRTALINCIRGIVKSAGARMPRCDADDFHLHSDRLPAGLQQALAPVLEQIGQLTVAIAGYDQTLKDQMDDMAPGARNLTTIPGVGPVTAVAYTLTIDDPSRFPSSRTVGAYFGLVPRRSQSGDSDPELRISKAGDTCVRQLLTQCAQVVLNICSKPSDLREWGLKHAGTTKVEKRKAVTAVARKLAVLMHRMLVTGERFDPHHASRNREATMRKTAA